MVGDDEAESRSPTQGIVPSSRQVCLFDCVPLPHPAWFLFDFDYGMPTTVTPQAPWVQRTCWDGFEMTKCVYVVQHFVYFTISYWLRICAKADRLQNNIR